MFKEGQIVRAVADSRIGTRNELRADKLYRVMDYDSNYYNPGGAVRVSPLDDSSVRTGWLFPSRFKEL